MVFITGVGFVVGTASGEAGEGGRVGAGRSRQGGLRGSYGPGQHIRDLQECVFSRAGTAAKLQPGGSGRGGNGGNRRTQLFLHIWQKKRKNRVSLKRASGLGRCYLKKGRAVMVGAQGWEWD